MHTLTILTTHAPLPPSRPALPTTHPRDGVVATTSAAAAKAAYVKATLAAALDDEDSDSQIKASMVVSEYLMFLLLGIYQSASFSEIQYCMI